MNMFSLENETALISGGATGIGLGIAKAIVEAGARVVLISRNEDNLQQAAAALGPRASYRVHDVTDVDRCEALVSDIEETIGPLTVLVNNAGNQIKKPAVDMTAEDFRAILDVHVLGAHGLTSAVGKRMLSRRRGSILFIASMTSLIGVPKVVAYSAAKAGYLGMVRSLATEWGPQGIRVNAIAPGWIDSDLLQGVLAGDPARHQKIMSRTPLGGLGQPDDIGGAAVFLCSPAARFVTGVCLPVDGGASIGF